MRNCLLLSTENCKLIKQSITVQNLFRNPAGSTLYQPPPEGWGLAKLVDCSRKQNGHSWNFLHLLFYSTALILEILIKTVKRVAHRNCFLCCIENETLPKGEFGRLNSVIAGSGLWTTLSRTYQVFVLYSLCSSIGMRNEKKKDKLDKVELVKQFLG